VARYRRLTQDAIDVPSEFDDYVIGRELGQGVTGRVYLAEDAVLARPVAIKFIARLDAAARQRFLFEARAVAQIHHPNVVAIYRVGTLDSRPYLVTELVRGQALDQVTKPMAWQAALDIGIGLARGLAAAHRRNVVHCDLKPANVVIDAEGVPKIIDFGLARIADGARPTGAPVGTPDYMAPEVWRGEPPGRRADVYSLGALLFELLAGKPPFSDVEPAALGQRVTGAEAPSLRDRAPGVDAALADVVARCLRRDREARFADGDELREALERLHASRRFAVRPGENPYRGLLPFEAGHRGLFFGRHSEIDAVVGRLRAEPLVLVTGDSGVGKSSLCRAGVVPAVVDGALGGAWRSLTIVPGRRPLSALASAIGDPELAARLRESPALFGRELRRHAAGAGLIVFLDQLEELVTLGDPAEVAALDAGLEALTDDIPGLRLLATVRADFLSRISTLPGLGRDLSRLLYFLRPLPPERLRDVIAGPAAAVGTRFESDAIIGELIAATAQAGSGGLPLLSFALADLWEARDRKSEVISSEAVTAMGGVAGALSRHADVVIGGMIAADRGHARRILLRLVTAVGTRARRSATELAVEDATRTVLDALVKGRLVVVHDGEPEAVYELAHECLLTGWPTLRQWLDADSAGRAVRERLSAAAAEWVRLGRRSDATWQGKRLYEAGTLDADSLGPDERAFIAASRGAERRRRRLRWLAGLGVIGLLVLGVAIQRVVARRELADAVDAVLGQARGERDRAGNAARVATQLEAWAFAVFDLGWRDDGELAWKYVLRERAAADHAYRAASDDVEAALAKDPARDDVRDQFGDLLLERALLADHVRALTLRDELLDRLSLYDRDGSRHRRWFTPGRVTVQAPPGAVITLEASGDSPVRPLGIATADASLSPGSYVIAIVAPGHAETRAPIRIERDRAIHLAIDPPLVAQVAPGLVYVPAGEFLFGHSNEDDRATFFSTTPLRSRHTDAFLISRTEVTFEDWAAYLDALPPDRRAERIPDVSSGVSGGVKLTPDGAGHWRIELRLVTRSYAAGWGQPILYSGRDRRAEQDWRRFPVLGVSAEDAAAYAAWLAGTGRMPGARLCTELEWERAARGADDRVYPGGRADEPDDINVDDTYGRPLRGPDEVGSHPASRSPFGLDDMSGNALEWTVAENGEFILRSGSYWHDRKSAQVINRSPLEAKAHDAAVGLRLCATPPLPH
jgi:formylglycine-generating enzyme required for sulfatase activity